MNYKQQIEQKADEYAKKELGKDSDKYANFYSGDIEAAYKAGAEAMREIANTWYDIENNPPANKQVICKILYTHLPKVKVFCQSEIDEGAHKMLGITHWKPITL